MRVISIQADTVDKLESQITSINGQGFSPTLCILFAPVVFDQHAISQVFNRLDIDFIGCSTAGEIVNDMVCDGIMVGLLFDIDKHFYRIFHQEYGVNKALLAAKSVGQMANDAFAHPALIITSGGLKVDAEQIVFGLKAGLGKEAPIFGGLAGDDLTFQGTFSLTRHGPSDNGLAALVLDNDKIEVMGLATSGWEGIGIEHVVTKAENNIVYTINNEPALDVFIKYFGYFDNSFVKGKSLSTISAQYPLQIIREDGTTVLRSPLIGSEEERTLLLAGGVRQGDKFRFSISPGFQVIDQTVKEFYDFYQAANEADALILFSCKGRHAALGPLIEDEIRGIYNYWKKPMIGFFSYGEIGPTKTGYCDFHNETCSLVLLKEKLNA
jgi:hypothetical protein